MTIFELHNDTIPTAENLAKGFLAEANQAFESHLDASYDIIQRFWYRNRDEEGKPALTGAEPSGIEILKAMGPNAKAVFDIVNARVLMLLRIQSQLNLANVIDVAKIMGPYFISFNEDGTFKEAVLR